MLQIAIRPHLFLLSAPFKRQALLTQARFLVPFPPNLGLSCKGQLELRYDMLRCPKLRCPKIRCHKLSYAKLSYPKLRVRAS